MIDILIPTYNRERDLIKNIKHLNNLVVSENIVKHFRILVSDNCSSDDIWSRLNEIESELNIEIIKFKQATNVGLERNAVFLLQKASSEFVIYIGDDDYLPKNYLTFIVNTIQTDERVCSIIPGISALYADGSTKPGRTAKFGSKRYAPGFMSALKLSCFGHQLSGILFKRAGLEKNYLRDPRYRNIYPFIFFLSYNILRGSSYYAPMYKVLVSESNSKDWRYDESGFLTEMFKNFNILFQQNPFKRILLASSILKKQGSSRLCVGKNFSLSLSLNAMIHIWKNPSTDFLIKLFLPVAISYFHLRKLLSAAKRMLASS